MIKSITIDNNTLSSSSNVDTMEKITIDNFLIFKKVEMPIKRFNLLIGEQASGKSLLSKLVHYFKDSTLTFTNCVVNGYSFEIYITRLEAAFLSNFPNEYWSDNKFEITYQIDSNYFKVKSNFAKKTKIRIELSNDFEKVYNQLCEDTNALRAKLYREETKRKEKYDEHRFAPPLEFSLRDQIRKQLSESSLSGFYESHVFIPSSRSFFANLEKNYWSITEDILDIDPLIKKFGRAYDNAKNFYKFFDRTNTNNISAKSDLSACLDQVIKAKYNEIDGEDWIIGSDYKVKLSRASSGQQEAFPMLLILSLNSFKRGGTNYNTIFIEEPEAHLFPDAQNKVMSEILKGYFNRKTNFFITTHSPYILTALNNSILAYDVINKGKLTQDKFTEMSLGSYPISFEDISAFSITKGELRNIKDSEVRLIGGELLDEISNQFGDIFNGLLELDE